MKWFTHLPQEDHAHNGNQYTCHLLLFGLPRRQAAVTSIECGLACLLVVASVWERPGHIPGVRQAATVEGILDGPNRLWILALEHVLPTPSQSAVQA
jgi:hypothetical protein